MPNQYAPGAQYLPEDPNLAVLILTIGILGVYLEFSAPGKIIPGAVGGAMVMIAITALLRLPLSMSGIFLLALALLCCLMEARFQSKGWLTALASALMVFGTTTLIRKNSGSPQIHPATAIAAALPFAVVSSFLYSVARRARRNKSITLAMMLIGAKGTMQTADLVRIHGENWNVDPKADLPAGTEVVVSGISGMTLLVRSAASGYAMEEKPL